MAAEAAAPAPAPEVEDRVAALEAKLVGVPEAAASQEMTARLERLEKRMTPQQHVAALEAALMV